MSTTKKKSISANLEEASMAPGLIALCFDARTKTHIAHLQTRSFAAHKALDEFYNGIIDLADSYAEAIQGRFGIIEQYPNAQLPGGGLETILTLRSWIDDNRGACGQYSELQNEIDSIVSLCNSAIYKLQNLS